MLTSCGDEGSQQGTYSERNILSTQQLIRQSQESTALQGEGGLAARHDITSLTYILGYF